MKRDVLITVLVLIAVAFAIYNLVRKPQAAVVTHYVSQVDGDNNRTCDQAQSPGAPLRTINKGASCLQPGGVLIIADGTYDELLISQTSSSRTCSSGDAAAQPGCAPFPNGRSANEPTRIVAQGSDTVISPVGRSWPGGGSAINVMDYARYIHIEGLRIVKNSASGSAGGIYVGNAQYITLQGNTLDDGQIKGGVSSRYLKVLGNEIFNTGVKSCPANQKPTPKDCPHGMYICGTDHVISDNTVRGTSYYGIQVSCEQGGIARIKIERNRVENNRGVGIRCAGEDCLVSANVLRGNGQGITLTGSGIVANNTIDSYYAASWNTDPTGIWTTWGDGSGFTITNNILTRQKGAGLLIGSVAGTPPNPSKVHHNLGEVSGNAGVTIIAPASAIYNDAQGGDYTLKAGGPAITSGVAQQHVPVDVVRTEYPVPSPDIGGYSSKSQSSPAGDTQPPTVRISNPPNNELLFGPTITLAATASDNVAVTAVQFKVDGQNHDDAVTNAPYQVNWDTTKVGNGPHSISAEASDAVGNKSSASISVNVQNAAPPVQEVVECSGRLESSGNLQFTCSKR